MIPVSNHEQQKAGVRQLFDTVAGGYDSPVMRYFPSAAERLAALLNPASGDRILDVACGTGVAAIALAQKIAPHGQVQAVDISDNMLDKARSNIQQAGLQNIDLHSMDAMQLDFPPQYFDAAACAFGLFFLPDVSAGAKAIFRVLKPGGQFIASTFSDTAFTPLIDLYSEQMAEFGVPAAQSTRDDLQHETDCRALFTEAGFIDVKTTRAQLGYHLADGQDWWEIIRNSALRGKLEQLDAPQQAAFRLKHLATIDKLADAEKIWLDVEVIYTIGTRPN
ncbi:MAG: class I SAM-dependent methyltransferase [Gammaproteobacteria bacterium]|nr:class I SAM-dependent methyltransferase [Gammaproteobacteria bacterium]